MSRRKRAAAGHCGLSLGNGDMNGWFTSSLLVVLAMTFAACGEQSTVVTAPASVSTAEAATPEPLTIRRWAEELCAAEEAFTDGMDSFDQVLDPEAPFEDNKAAAHQLNERIVAITTRYVEHVGALTPPEEVAEYHSLLVGTYDRVRALAQAQSVELEGISTWSEIEASFLSILDQSDAEAAALDAASMDLPPLALSALTSVPDCEPPETSLPDR